MPGSLFIIATPVGNLSDISLRTRKTLEESDLILAEDTRVTIKILNHLGIKKRMLSCHEFNERSRLSLISEAKINNQQIALVSDAGTPLISDPGFQIVREAIACGMKVIAIPGPSAFLLALVGSGIASHRFVFEGFLPDKPTEMKRRLNELKTEKRTLVFYVSPHKLVKTLQTTHGLLGDRQACLARELTKIHEEFIRLPLSELIAVIEKREIIGECVLIIAGAETGGHEDDKESIKEKLNMAIKEMLAADLSTKDIVAGCVRQYGLRKSAVYEVVLKYRQSKNSGESEEDNETSPAER